MWQTQGSKRRFWKTSVFSAKRYARSIFWPQKSKRGWMFPFYYFECKKATKRCNSTSRNFVEQPFVTQGHKRNWVNFICENRDCNPQQWESVVFSDKKSVILTVLMEEKRTGKFRAKSAQNLCDEKIRVKISWKELYFCWMKWQRLNFLVAMRTLQST